MHPRAAALVRTLGLAPHPEGGWYGEIHRSATVVTPDDGRGERRALTVIYFLLADGQVSQWHRVASDEVWHYHEGDRLELSVASAPGAEDLETHVLGPVDAGGQPVRVVRAGQWQTAGSTGAFTFVSCSVGPGFEFVDFEMRSV